MITCNIGDMLQRLTNHVLPSTTHRVVNPPRALAADSDRQSLVFFHQPNYDAMVSPLPTCIEPGAPPRYAPISSGDHLRNKFVAQTTMGKESAQAA